MKSLLLLLLPFSALAATETDIACNLERSKAEVQASVLAAPQAFASLGQDAATGEKNAQVGITQSLAGRTRASLLREAADAKCYALASTLALDEHARWNIATIKRQGALAELKLVEDAILLAKSNISQLDAQLAAQVITINQHTEARQQLVSLEGKQADLLRQLSQVVLTSSTASIPALLTSAMTSEARAAEFAAKSQAAAGWDVVLTAGARQPFSGGNPQPFATVGVKYSFGYEASKRAAVQVGAQTAELLAIQQGGYAQTATRLKKEVEDLQQAEALNSTTNSRQLVHVRKVRASLVGIETTLSLNTIRALDLQILLLQADLAGSDARLAGYQELLQKL